MKNQFRLKALSLTVLISAAALLSSFTAQKGGIKGWFLAGSARSSYEIGLEQDNGNKTAYLKSTKPVEKGFGTLMQQFVPKDYRGKRVKLTAKIKSEDVVDWAGMWMRIDGENNKNLGFDNMQERPIVGSTDWKTYEIILDVPMETESVAYGVLLAGTGKIWADEFNFEIVENTTKTTGTSTSVRLEAPSNTGFEEDN